jgi:hypothetical protein
MSTCFCSGVIWCGKRHFCAPFCTNNYLFALNKARDKHRNIGKRGCFLQESWFSSRGEFLRLTGPTPLLPDYAYGEDIEREYCTLKFAIVRMSSLPRQALGSKQQSSKLARVYVCDVSALAFIRHVVHKLGAIHTGAGNIRSRTVGGRELSSRCLGPGHELEEHNLRCPPGRPLDEVWLAEQFDGAESAFVVPFSCTYK